MLDTALQHAHALLLFGGLAAVTIVLAGVFIARGVDAEADKAEPQPAASADGQTLVIDGKAYGLHGVTHTLGFPYWVLSLPAPAAHTFTVQREDGLEALIEHLGLMSVVQTGNAHYDSEFEIRSPDQDWAKAFFSDAEHRRLVQALFGADSKTVVLSKGRVQAYFRERSDLTEGGPALAELAEALSASS